jgi:hypothetical protein
VAEVRTTFQLFGKGGMTFENLLAEQAEGDLATPRSGCGAVDERSLSSVSTVTLP